MRNARLRSGIDEGSESLFTDVPFSHLERGRFGCSIKGGEVQTCRKASPPNASTRTRIVAEDKAVPRKRAVHSQRKRSSVRPHFGQTRSKFGASASGQRMTEKTQGTLSFQIGEISKMHVKPEFHIGCFPSITTASVVTIGFVWPPCATNHLIRARSLFFGDRVVMPPPQVQPGKHVTRCVIGVMACLTCPAKFNR